MWVGGGMPTAAMILIQMVSLIPFLVRCLDDNNGVI